MSKQLKVTCPSVNVKVVELDLSPLQSIRQAAMQLDGMTERIDILINNAGVMGLSDRTLSEDGVEMQFATNYLGMVSSAAHGPHSQTSIVNITSAGHVLAPVRFSDYNYKSRSVPPEEQPDVYDCGQNGHG
jgi:NAD(P)-dependent dehydrogenase (short-subunit alcohol dehydrogenase family)